MNKMGRPRKNVEKSFWSKVDKREDHECWNWKASCSGNGYGAFWDSCRSIGAHRYAWELTRKCKVPEGKMVLHMCDNKLCCNPSHLYCGDALQNAKDKVERTLRGGYESKIREMFKLPEELFT